MKRALLIVPFFLALLIGISGCARQDAVVLSVDFSTRPVWHYNFSVASGGRMAIGDSTSSFTHALRCKLTGHGDSSDISRLDVATSDVELESSVFDEAEAAHMKRLLDNFHLKFSLRDGIDGTGDSVPFPSVRTGQWDLYRQFVKILPVLPQGTIMPGFCWDRNKQLPLPTNQGTVTGHLYQQFKFDSLSRGANGNRWAYLSWKFSYAVDIAKVDTSSILDDVPHKGQGIGLAVIDIDGKCLREASVTFVIPQGAPSKMYAIEWNETASLKLGE